MSTTISREPSDASATAPSSEPRPLIEARGWRNVLREFLIIVAGVLAALMAQAWWQYREDRSVERDYLKQLLADATANQERLASAISNDSSVQVTLNTVVRLLHSNATLPSNDSLARMMVLAVSSSDFQPVSGSFEALLSAGDLRLLRSDSVRGQVVTYAANLAYERDMLLALLEPVIGSAGNMARVLPFMRTIFVQNPDSIRAGGYNFEAHRNDVDLAELLLTLQAANSNRLSHLRMMRSYTAETLAVLQGR